MMLTLPLFHNPALLEQALTHRSYVNEHPLDGPHNERLEFLGDAVLNFLSGEFLFKRYLDKPEGELTPLRSALVDEIQLAEFAIALGLGDRLRLGRGAEQDGGRQNPNLLSSAFEAMIGAYFLDSQSEIDRVRAFVEPLFGRVVETHVVQVLTINYKSRFQEWALATIGENPTYSIVREVGPAHAREFTAEVWVGPRRFGKGKGRRKQDAEKMAAKVALEQMGLV